PHSSSAAPALPVLCSRSGALPSPHSFPTRRSSDLLHPGTAHTPVQRQRYDETRHAVTELFRAAQHEFRRANELDNRGDDNPLTSLERLELASLCSALADAFDRAADTWNAYLPTLPITAAYRQQALDLRDAAELNTALAEIAPATADADPFTR